MTQHDPLYASLRTVLDRAYDQAAKGKGRERHSNGEPFDQQLIVKLGQFMGDSSIFNIGQACKKSIESLRLPVERGVAEILGAINYLAGAVLIIEGAVPAPAPAPAPTPAPAPAPAPAATETVVLSVRKDGTPLVAEIVDLTHEEAGLVGATHTTLHKLWTRDVGRAGYNKQDWLKLSAELDQCEEVLRRGMASIVAERRSKETAVNDQTEHQERIEAMMRAYGQVVPAEPTVPDQPTRELRARLILEEAMETVLALGVQVTVPGAAIPGGVLEFKHLTFSGHLKPDMVEVADGCADISVVTIGTLSACGIKDKALLEEVDSNNMAKAKNGHRDPATGKWIKPKDHPPPRVREILAKQGLVQRPW